LLKAKLEDFAVLQSQVGQGTFGVVNIAYWVARDGTKEKPSVAVKTVPLAKQDNRRSFLNELDSLGAADHPHIVKVFAATEAQRSGMGYLVLELCRGGDLFEHVSHKRGLNETEAAGLARQMLLAVAYLHARKVVHRDVKTENFLFLEKSRESL
jgi:serine/threonine protein kinase